MSLELLSQAVIFLTGCPAVVLSQMQPLRHRRWSPILGMLGQPAWFFSTWAQWGMFAMCFLYTGAWCLGIWNYWLRPALEKRNGIPPR